MSSNRSSLREDGVFADEEPPQPDQNVQEDEIVSTAHLRGSSAEERTSGGSSVGREQYYMTKNCFDDMVENGRIVGSVCKACGYLIRDKQRRATMLSRHAAACLRLPADVRERVVSEASALNKGFRILPNQQAEDRKRPISFSADSASGKRRRVDNAEDAEALTAAMLEMFVEQAWSFTVLDTTKARPNAFMKLLQLIAPWYVNKFFPSRDSLTGRYLDALHASVTDRVTNRLKHDLTIGYGTIIFNGWSDATGTSAVNVLLRTEGSGLRSKRRTFFLESVFTSHDKVGSEAYVRIVERVMEKFGGMERICAVSSDSATCCRKARDEVTQKYPGLVGFQDQAHVANLCVQDIRSLPWVKEILDRVACITTETKQKVKLRARVAEAIAEYNNTVASRHSRPETRAQEEGVFSLTGLFPPLPPTAVMLRKPARTRFASIYRRSIERTLEAFIRTRVVLLGVVQDPDFESNLWEASNGDEREKRDRFISCIESRTFLSKVEDLHKIFRLLCRYLRVFDSDEAMISDVVPKTIALGIELERVRITDFMTAERKQQIMSKFYRDGAIGGSIRVRLLESIHFAAHLLDPSRSPKDVRAFLPRLQMFISSYCASRQPNSNRELDVAACNSSQAQRQRLLEQFIELSGAWEDQKCDAGDADIFLCFRNMPLVFWRSFVDAAKYPELVEFATRILSVSPSSCAAERSFSMQDRMRTKSRNRMQTEKVKKLAFVHWNMKLLGDRDFEPQDFLRSVHSREDQEGQLDFDGSDNSEDEDDESCDREFYSAS